MKESEYCLARDIAKMQMALDALREIDTTKIGLRLIASRTIIGNLIDEFSDIEFEEEDL